MNVSSEEPDWEKVEVHEGHEVQMIYRSTLATYNVQVFAPPTDYFEHVRLPTEQDKRVLADLPAMLELIEDELERALPEGYRVRITEWNK